MEIISNIALITINETLIVQLISFLLFLYVINRVMFRPLRKVMSERDTYIENLQGEIADQQNELQQISAQIKQKEQAVIQEARHMSKEHEKNGNREAAQIIGATRAELNTLKAKTAKEIENGIVEARQQLGSETNALVVNIMEKILDRRLAS